MAALRVLAIIDDKAGRHGDRELPHVPIWGCEVSGFEFHRAIDRGRNRRKNVLFRILNQVLGHFWYSSSIQCPLCAKFRWNFSLIEYENLGYQL